MPPITTRTVGPLHLEDLEPHRFEDLVRQLVYDFRQWRMLEATGRAGSDDGFDARGYEIVGEPERAPEVSDEDEREPEEEVLEADRLWLVQCKRERSIGPAKLSGYLDAVDDQGLHGLIFAAACDFSKAARDRFREKAREKGLSEFVLWGKAEIEDQLFQPRNDHLLFAYFGFSLQVRRRTLRAELRGRLAMKRKCKRHLVEGRAVLVRDASDDRYPWLAEDERLSRVDRGRWKAFTVAGFFHDGLRLVFRRHFAFVDDDEQHWDFAETMNDGPPSTDDDRWDAVPEGWDARHEAWEAWEQLPEVNRAWLEVSLVLPYEHILDIDADGDDMFAGPHVFTVPFAGDRGPFGERPHFDLRGGGRWSGLRVTPYPANRIEKFARSPAVAKARTLDLSPIEIIFSPWPPTIEKKSG